MREFKLRAWHNEQELILTVESIDFVAKLEEEDSIGYLSFEEGIPGYSEEIQGYQRTETDYACPLKDVILMQYIGIKDKNNKPIYEGDIVKTKWQHCGITNYNYEVIGIIEYCEKLCAFVIYDNLIDAYYQINSTDTEKLLEIEVIGNLYENPEILKESKNED